MKKEKLTHAEADACHFMLSEGVLAFNRVIERVCQDAGLSPIDKGMAQERIRTATTIIENGIARKRED